MKQEERMFGAEYFLNFDNTNRITVGVEAAEKFAIICPLNDEKKRYQVKKWIRQRNLVNTLKKIEEQGIPYNKWWL